MLLKVVLLKDFPPKDSLRNDLRHKYHLGVLVYIWNKNRTARGSGELFRVLYHEHIGLIVSLKACRWLCSSRWLKFNLRRVSNFKPLIPRTAKTEFSLGLTKLRILNLNIFIEPRFLSSSLRFPHFLAQCGKKDYSKVLVLPLKVFVDFWVAYRVTYALTLLHGVR